MARYTGAVCRLCRREDMKLFLKGERCYTDKCGYERRSVSAGPARPEPPPQALGLRRAAAREAEGQAHLRHRRAPVPRLLLQGRSQATGVTGHTLIQLLERRLDNVVYRMGFASDHAEARQLVRHGHFTINGKKVNIPSYLVRPRDVDPGPRVVAEDRAHQRGARRRRSPRCAAVDPARQGQLPRRDRPAAVARGRDAADPRAAHHRALHEVVSSFGTAKERASKPRINHRP